MQRGNLKLLDVVNTHKAFSLVVVSNVTGRRYYFKCSSFLTKEELALKVTDYRLEDGNIIAKVG